MLFLVTCRYGTFSDGLGADERPYVWEGSVVTLYAETNRGMSGVVLSTKFSVGYLVHSDAAAAKLRFATLLNTAGSEHTDRSLPLLASASVPSPSSSPQSSSQTSMCVTGGAATNFLVAVCISVFEAANMQLVVILFLQR